MRNQSFTGVELIRVLLDNKVRPILMIAFTNHALDHMLTSVLDAGITSRIVRLGSRSADERISQFSMENLELVAGQSRLDRTVGQHHRSLKDIQLQITRLMSQILKTSVESEKIVQHIEIQYPEHFEHILQPPDWVSLLMAHSKSDDHEQWQQVGKRGCKVDAEDDSIYTYWRTGRDLEFLSKQEEPKPQLAQAQTPLAQKDVSNQNKFQALVVDPNSGSDTDSSDSELDDDESDSDLPQEPWQRSWAPLNGQATPAPAAPVLTAPAPIPVFTMEPQISGSDKNDISLPATANIEPSDFYSVADFFIAQGCIGVPLIPKSNRPLEMLLDEGEMWEMSLSERERLHNHWTERVKSMLQIGQQQVRAYSS
jgi:hypothetical protein